MSQYQNPPIIEALCEFRFSKDTKWDPTIPGILYENVKTQYPLKESRIDQQFEIKKDKNGNLQQNLKIGGQKAIFLAENRQSLIQIGQRILSINCLKPYPGWDTFKERIEFAYKTINDLTKIQEIDRISLVYVDKIEIPGTIVEMEKYFKFYPFLSPELPQTHNAFMVGCDFPYKNNRDICKLQLNTAISEKKDSCAFLLTTEYFLAKKGSITPEKALQWVDESHTTVKGLFKGCITEKLEDLFGRT
jgi:hypothetical protein